MTTSTHSVIDFSKLMEQVKLPGFDMTSVIETQRKNIEALTAANQLAYEGMQALVKKQAEMFNERVQEIQAEVQKASSGNPVEGLSQRADFVQQTFQKIFDDMRELAEMAQKAQTETLAAISQRAAQDVKEAKTAAKHK
ncbi:phasin family protein [Paraburkholderia phenazinium]|jgi:phasin family protein|uniref:Phasin family protein n=1 Tax=Paraburkholderia phenazinium TaxID=60549 RepID=A0A1G7SE19_9BURK|nr:TIGR01841 family phasin [Paraburkholderia phenazinium]SDG21132.1 phasin family protein [Paraburkholderia phenazinium]